MNDFGVIKTTTDKLETELNRLAEVGAPVQQIEYLGGRDWVIIHGQSEMDAWHPNNWAPGKQGLLPAGFCNTWPADGTQIPCLYQRGHIGRHHFDPHEVSDSLPPQDDVAEPRECKIERVYQALVNDGAASEGPEAGITRSRARAAVDALS